MANFMANYGVWILILQLAVGVVGGIINDPQDESTLFQPANMPSSHMNKHTWMASRQKRDFGLDGNCNTWSPWYDKNFPSSSNKNESETIPQKLREQFCPAYGTTDEVQCKDDNGEPFVADRINANVEIRIRQFQVTCTLVNPAFKGCPNLAIRFKCACSNTQPASTPLTRLQTLSKTADVITSEPTIAPKVTSSAAFATHYTPGAGIVMKSSTHLTPGAGIDTTSSTQHTLGSRTGANPPNTQQHQENNGTHVVESNADEYLNFGDFRVPWWIAVLVVSAILFIFNLLITVCLYKKLRNEFQHNIDIKNSKIHPLRDI